MNLESKIERYYKVIGSEGFNLADGFDDFYSTNKKCFVKEIEYFGDLVFKAQT